MTTKWQRMKLNLVHVAPKTRWQTQPTNPKLYVLQIAIWLNNQLFTITQREKKLVERWLGDSNLRGPPGNTWRSSVLLWWRSVEHPFDFLFLCKFECGWLKPVHLWGVKNTIAWWWVWDWSKYIVIVITLVTYVLSKESLNEYHIYMTTVSWQSSQAHLLLFLSHKTLPDDFPLSLQCLSGGIVSLSSVSVFIAIQL